jgi:hypothetical protein
LQHLDQANGCASSAKLTVIDALHGHSASADFVHTARRPVPRNGRSAYDLYRQLASVVPVWFDGLMWGRNQAMKALRMKDLGSLRSVPAESGLAPGDRAGIFTIQSKSQDCLMLEDSDKHLRVQLAVQWQALAREDEIVVSTVVHTRNGVGRFYMLPVAPIHRLIVPYLLSRV